MENGLADSDVRLPGTDADANAPQAVDDMLNAMRRANAGGGSSVDFDLPFLKEVFENPEMEFLLQTYDKLLEHADGFRDARESEKEEGREKETLLNKVQGVLSSFALESKSSEKDDDDDDATGAEDEKRALASLFNESHLKSLVEAYDDVVGEKFDVGLDRSAFDELEETNGVDGSKSMENGELRPLIKIVGIHKRKDEPLGITLKIDEERNLLKIARVIKGGTIDKQGLLHAGDIIHAVNSLSGSPMDMKARMGSAKGSITLKIEAVDYDVKETPIELFVRAHFDFKPKDYSTSIPSVGAGLPFQRGDVLGIIDKSDVNWWQACHATIDDDEISDEERTFGLVPGQIFEERRRVSFYSADFAVASNETDSSSSQTSCIPFGKRREKRRLMYTSNRNHEFDKHELILYEEVTRIIPGQRKVVVLLGAQGVGRRSLKKRLMASKDYKFGTTVPHTSRSKKSGEVNGGIYWFVSRSEMEQDILAHKFIEYGEYDDELYGTKVDSVRGVIQKGRICVLDVSPLALKFLRTSEFKPFIVFIAAPGAAKLRELRRACSPDQSGKPPTERELSKTIEESKRLERDYANYFDLKLVNENIDDTFADLEKALENLDKEAQWVPVSWLY